MSDQPKIELWDIDKLVPYALNAKNHPEHEIEKLANAILTYGWTQPIVVWTNGDIIAGHGRRLAAIKLGRKKVPVIVRSDLTKDQADALRLADNRVTGSSYDMAMIQDELRRLSETDIDLLTLGFDEKELDFSTADLGEIDTDFFTDDISGAVEAQQQANAKKTEEVDDTAAPVGDALGFKRVTIAQSRIIRDFMSKVEDDTGLKGADALVTYIGARS
ncbi:ParB/Srx family N-terminal domain-containing protein [Shinella zoogloeoides]|uniref:ParB/Srx family N-terminal domain-containing protein n=1 Tax=Shinella zoogloeoides TaxID=352475 RepID=UPI00274009AD|nr:ParB/Srx family N-terminal domain-containing protein [Shinella zoogloeoides]WLR90982.1 ParB/Srx family N-terminal domain-containing protein [Shinella zoogloeoides]